MYPGLSHGAYECLHAHGTPEQKNGLSAEAGLGRMDRHHVPDRAALRHRPRHAAHEGRAASATAPTRSPAPRSSSPPANTIWPTTSCTWCSRACRMRREGTKGISLFMVPKFMPERGRRTPASATAMTCGSIEDKMGIHGNATCVMNLDGATRLADRRAEQGPERDVRDDERGAPRRRHAGLGLTEVAYQNSLAYAKDRLQMRCADRPEGAGQAGRPDHRASGRAPHAADAEGLRRRRPRVQRTGSRCRSTANCRTPTKRCARKPPTWSRC